MIVLVSLIALLRRLLVPTVFRMVHPYICIHSFLHLFHVFLRRYISRLCSCADAQIYGAAPCHHVLSAEDGIVFSSPPYTVQCS